MIYKLVIELNSTFFGQSSKEVNFNSLDKAEKEMKLMVAGGIEMSSFLVNKGRFEGQNISKSWLNPTNIYRMYIVQIS